MTLELGKLIADLLREHNRVSLPGIGAFVGNYQPAILKEDTLELAPPYKEVIFSKDETWNDELLEKLVAKVEEVSDDKAKKTVAKEVAKILAELNKNGSFAFPGLGRLVKETWRVNFEMEEGVNLLTDAFGLETISMPIPTIQPEKKKPQIIETPIAAPQKQEQPIAAVFVAPPIASVASEPISTKKKRSFTPWIIASIFVGIIAVGAYLYINDMVGSKAPIAALPTIASNDSTLTTTSEPTDTTGNSSDTTGTTVSEKKIVAETIDSKTEKRKALYYEEPKNEHVGDKTFYIIAGSFNKMENAEKLKQTLIKEGYKPEVLTDEGPVFRVSMYSFTNKNRALQELSRLRDQNKELNIWLLGL